MFSDPIPRWGDLPRPLAPWNIDAEIYQDWKGVHAPWICEIGPSQYARMSERQKKAYRKKRDEEWEASAAVKREWNDRVKAAFLAGIISLDTPGLYPGAKDVIRWTIDDLEKEQQKKAAEGRRAAKQITSIDQIQVGEKVFSPIYGPGTVIKKNKKTAKVHIKRSDMEFDVNLEVHMMEKAEA